MEVDPMQLNDHIDRMHSQREELFARLRQYPADVIWTRPAPKEWSVGENLDHMVVLYRSMFPLVVAAWVFTSIPARLVRRRSYSAKIDNVYVRPGFPQNVGWIWPPRWTPEHPASLEQLYQNMAETHRMVADYYQARAEELLGHIWLYDPVIGWLNLIQTLQVGVYHNALHVGQIERTLGQVRG